MKASSLGIIIASAFLGMNLQAQFIYSEEPILSSVNEIVVCPNVNHSDGLRFNLAREEFKHMQPKISRELDPQKAFNKKDALVLTEIVKTHDGAKNDYYLALVQPKEGVEIPNQLKRPLYFDAKDLVIQAEFLVDSAKFEDAMFQDIYLENFMLFLAADARFEEQNMKNYYKGAFYLYDIDSIFVYKNELDERYAENGLSSILLNSRMIEEKSDDSKAEATAVELNTTDRSERKWKSENTEKLEIEQNPLVAKLKEGEELTFFTIVPFTYNDQPAIQKFILSSKNGLLYTDTRILEEGQKAEITRDDIGMFKNKPDDSDKEQIRIGKIDASRPPRR